MMVIILKKNIFFSKNLNFSESLVLGWPQTYYFIIACNFKVKINKFSIREYMDKIQFILDGNSK